MSLQTPLHGFSNVGFNGSGRNFAGFTSSNGAVTSIISPRSTKKLELQAGDLLNIQDVALGTPLLLVAFMADGQNGLSLLGLPTNAALDLSEFDAAPMVGWSMAQGAETIQRFPAHSVQPSDDVTIFKAIKPVTVWAVRPTPTDRFVECQGGGSVTVRLQRANISGPDLPPLLGDTVDEFTVQSGSGRAYELKKGEYVQIIDVEGQQCSDFMAFCANGLDGGHELMIDSTATRTMVHRSFPGPGMLDKFYDREMRPLLNMVQDTCGRHDTFGLACTSRGYEERGFPGHVNCSDNITHAMQPYGVARRAAWPAINFFWNTWVDHHSHHIMTEESHSRPGDYVVMRAMEDLVVVSTACPDDIDPINGWNPTDVHVRIYKEETPIRRAVAYREKEDAPMSISQESAFHERLAPLTQHFTPARDLWAPVNFPATGTLGEYWACRNAVTLQDMSGLRKFDVVGPDAEKLLQLATTRNVSKLAEGRGHYTLICDDSGHVIDDGTLFRLEHELFRWFCGSEESGRVLETLAETHNFQVRINAMRDAMPNLALQGPKSRDLLRKILFTQPNVANLDQLKWFGVTVGRLNDRDGAPFMLSRSGYTGELGYEIFCAKSDAVKIWDALMEAGEEFGIVPMGSAALEIIRIEAGLAAANAEFSAETDAFEAGLGFAVDLKKEEFVGKAALERNAKDPRRVLKGLLMDCDDVPAHGAPVFSGERQVGVVTSATRSPMLERAIAMARILVEHADNETKLEVGQMDGRMKRLDATVTDIPFIDPQRKRARA